MMSTGSAGKRSHSLSVPVFGCPCCVCSATPTQSKSTPNTGKCYSRSYSRTCLTRNTCIPVYTQVYVYANTLMHNTHAPRTPHAHACTHTRPTHSRTHTDTPPSPPPPVCSISFCSAPAPTPPSSCCCCPGRRGVPLSSSPLPTSLPFRVKSAPTPPDTGCRDGLAEAEGWMDEPKAECWAGAAGRGSPAPPPGPPALSRPGRMRPVDAWRGTWACCPEGLWEPAGG